MPVDEYQLFHKQRIMFAIVPGEKLVILSDPGFMTHEQWFKARGWERYLDSATRGYWHAPTNVVAFYSGPYFDADARDEKAFLANLRDLVYHLSIPGDARVWAGVQPQDKPGGQWPPRKELGTVAKFLPAAKKSYAKKTMGCGVFVVRYEANAGHAILLGRRGPECKWGSGLWALPGGMIDEGDTLEQTALKEVEQETGLVVSLPVAWPPFCVRGLLAVTDHTAEEMHPEMKMEHMSSWILAHYRGGEPQIKEPTKCLEWRWWHLRQLRLIEGCHDRAHPQYYWLPFDLWQHLLRPHCGEF